MFTGRSEFRLTLRSDNADLRLTQKGYDFGCVSAERYAKFQSFKKKYDLGIDYLKSVVKSVVYWKSKIPSIPMTIDNPVNKNMFELLRFENCDLDTLKDLIEPKYNYLLEDKELSERIKIQGIYDYDESRQLDEITEMKKHESISLPPEFDYNRIVSLSNEAKERLFNHKPTSLGAASRIPGITPSAVFRIFAHFKSNQQNIVR